MSHYYEFNPRLGSTLEEKALGAAVDSLKGANSEALVHFLHITLNNLCSMLVRPTVNEESADIPSKAFEAMSSIVQRIQRLDLPTDKHARNTILTSYVQFVFSSPVAQYAPGAFDSRTATLKGRLGSTETSEFGSAAAVASAAFKKGGSVRGTKGISFNGGYSWSHAHFLTFDPIVVPMSEYEDGEMSKKASAGTHKLFHEELVLQWIVAHPGNTRPLVLKNAWFFFELLVSVLLHSLF